MDSVPAIGFTSFDHRQPGSNCARPIVEEPTFTTWTLPCSNVRVSPESTFTTSAAIRALLSSVLPNPTLRLSA